MRAGPVVQTLPPAQGGGVKIESMNRNDGGGDTSTHAANTWFDITGSGIFMVAYNATSDSVPLRIQVDEAPISRVWH